MNYLKESRELYAAVILRAWDDALPDINKMDYPTTLEATKEREKVRTFIVKRRGYFSRYCGFLGLDEDALRERFLARLAIPLQRRKAERIMRETFTGKAMQ